MMITAALRAQYAEQHTRVSDPGSSWESGAGYLRGSGGSGGQMHGAPGPRPRLPLAWLG